MQDTQPGQAREVAKVVLYLTSSLTLRWPHRSRWSSLTTTVRYVDILSLCGASLQFGPKLMGCFSPLRSGQPRVLTRWSCWTEGFPLVRVVSYLPQMHCFGSLTGCVDLQVLRLGSFVWTRIQMVASARALVRQPSRSPSFPTQAPARICTVATTANCTARAKRLKTNPRFVALTISLGLQFAASCVLSSTDPPQ